MTRVLALSVPLAFVGASVWCVAQVAGGAPDEVGSAAAFFAMAGVLTGMIALFGIFD